MASGFLFIDGRDPDAVFTAGNAGITTGLLHASSGTDLGSLYAAGNSGITTGLISRTGADIGSLFATSGGGGPIANPSYGNLVASVGEPSGTWTATATCNIETTGQFVTNTSGNWYLPTTSGIGSNYKVQFAVTTATHTNGTLNITNPAPTPTTISANEILQISLQYTIIPNGPAATATGTYTVNIYDNGGTLVSASTNNWSLTVQSV